MSRYEQRLERDIGQIRRTVSTIGADVLSAFKDAVHAVMVHDKELASRIVLQDLPINRAIRALDATCHAFVARHLPAAGPLRLVSSVLRINIALERIGDYAVTIAREQIQLTQPPPEAVARDIDLLADQAREMLSQALKAHDEQNPELARGTKAINRNLDRTFARIFDDLIAAGDKDERPLKDLFALLVMLNRITRVGDQAKNLCEEVVFAATGETKAPKQYRILFLDERDDGLTQMAVAYARRAFPDIGHYSSAGFSPAEELDGEARKLLGSNGYELEDQKPSSFGTLRDDLTDLHVIVGMAENTREKIDWLPFHTTLLQWDVPAELTLFEDKHRFVCAQVADLMELLRGEGATS